MKKIVLGAAFAMGLAVATNAQQVELSKTGDVLLNAGIGFDSASATPIYVGADYFVTDDISVGGKANYASKTYGVYGSASVFGIGAIGNYHFNKLINIPSEWDIYGGIGFTYYSVSFKSGQDLLGTIAGSTTTFSGQVGARYFFTPNLGANVEFGGNNTASGGSIGITYKL